MIKNIEDLKKEIQLNNEEEAWSINNPRLPILISDHYFAHIDKDDINDPIRKQVVPSCLEGSTDDLKDPLNEVTNSVFNKLIHRYNNRAALLVTDKCFTYCRHCFRSRFTAKENGFLSEEELEKALTYLKENKYIKELLLTGGDLFTLRDDQIDYLLSRLKDAREDLILRLCTRAIVTEPARFTDNLLNIIKKHQKGAPFFLLTQYNHARELTEESIAALRKFSALGIAMFNQSVLLKGVNDNVDTLEELCNKLLYNNVKPYYLFQGDLVQGTKHLRVDIKDGLAIEKELRNRLSGLAMPQYTIDLPHGGGKVILTHNYLEGECDGIYKFSTYDKGDREYS